MTKTPIEEKIALLLKKAESTDSPQEAEALTEAAEKLMIKHGIERAMLDLEHDKKEEIIIERHAFTGIYSYEHMLAAVAVAEALGLRAYFIDRRRAWENKSVIVSVVGFESDVADAMQLIMSLHAQSAVALKAYGKNELPSWYSGMEKYKARRAFVEYFGRGAAKRIKSNRRQVVEESTPGTALVLVSREEKVNAHYNSLGLGTKRDRRDTSWDGMSAGYRDGQNANTGEKQISSRKSVTA